MKVAVCGLGNDETDLAEDWKLLVEHVKKAQSELILLPEMPFLTLDFDLGKADEAKHTYPRYVKD